MSEFTRPPEQTRYDADPDRVAIVLPGANYPPAGPLLHFARLVLVRRGWTVQELWWNAPVWTDRATAVAWVRARAADALAREHAPRKLLVGKSLGSMAAGLAADQGLPAVWFTPLLTDSDVAAALQRRTAPVLLAGGTADRLWNSDTARDLDAEILEIPGADHALETPDDPLGSVEILGRVVVALEEFVVQL
jgi:pimeloyl-ACP methyl ester carboxylesterase